MATRNWHSLAPNQALGVEHGARRVDRRLVLGSVTDETLIVVAPRNVRRRDAVTLHPTASNTHTHALATAQPTPARARFPQRRSHAQHHNNTGRVQRGRRRLWAAAPPTRGRHVTSAEGTSRLASTGPRTWSFAMISTRPPLKTPTHEYVVPKSMPMTGPEPAASSSSAPRTATTASASTSATAKRFICSAHAHTPHTHTAVGC